MSTGMLDIIIWYQPLADYLHETICMKRAAALKLGF